MKLLGHAARRISTVHRKVCGLRTTKMYFVETGRAPCRKGEIQAKHTKVCSGPFAERLCFRLFVDVCW
jgi:hypothetical protein